MATKKSRATKKNPENPQNPVHGELLIPIQKQQLSLQPRNRRQGINRKALQINFGVEYVRSIGCS